MIDPNEMHEDGIDGFEPPAPEPQPLVQPVPLPTLNEMPAETPVEPEQPLIPEGYIWDNSSNRLKKNGP